MTGVILFLALVYLAWEVVFSHSRFALLVLIVVACTAYVRHKRRERQ